MYEFAVIGCWVVLLFIMTVISFMGWLLLSKFNGNGTAILIGMTIGVVLLTLVISWRYVSFQFYPEQFGYTQIIQEED